MNDMIVPSSESPAPANVLERLASELHGLTPQLRKAAAYVLDNPNEIGVSSIREIADAAYLGPALIDDGLVRLHVKTRPTTNPGAGIDDLTGTCGIWICNPFGDDCLCTEWECTLDGPSGSFP